ncbi:MAG: Glycerol-3-phosphate dehydrogenase [Francisellaceae bacterium]|nr:Glycerol-3-phosphate dehydrogenase [Francisellaceae bacterium]
MKKTSIAVLGAGSWGCALANLLARNGHKVNIWGRDIGVIQEINISHQNNHYLPNIPLAESIQAFTNLFDALINCEIILIAVPSHAFKDLLLAIKSLNLFKNKTYKILWATKGLNKENEIFLDKLVIDLLGPGQLAVLSGPSFAIEVAAGKPTAVVIASPSTTYVKELAQIFSSDFFRVYLSNDLIGVQLGGVVKNILAVCCGISDGLDLGANARAALITRGMVEMKRLGKAMGAQLKTLSGLTGFGDAILSCTDDKSRNRRFGLLIGRGINQKEALESVGQTVEALYNIKEICNIAEKLKVEMPIARGLLSILNEGISPKKAVQNLFSRPLKKE